MDGDEQYPASSRSVESLREVRLLGLLRDVVADQGKVKAAETLGVSFRTLSRAEDTGQLTPRLADALESHLVQGGGTAAAQQRRMVAGLTDRVAALEKALPEGLEALRHEGQSAVGEQAQALGKLARRVAALEAAGSGSAAVNVGAPAGRGGPQSQPGNQAPATFSVAQRPRRAYPDLVTAEAEPGEELVYGDEATALIIQWRTPGTPLTRPLTPWTFSTPGSGAWNWRSS